MADEREWHTGDVYDNITVGTSGGQDWKYESGAPFGYSIVGGPRPFSLFGCVTDMDVTGEVLKDQLLEYVSYSGAIGENITFTDGPKYTIYSYKLAFLKSGDTDTDVGSYALHCYDGNSDSVRPVTYNDLLCGFNKRCGNADHWAGSFNFFPISANLYRSGGEDVRFIVEETTGSVESHYIGGIPVFYEDDPNSDMVGYLLSMNPNPNDFGGTGGEGKQDDYNTPGDNIEGLGTDPGLNLTRGLIRAAVLSDTELTQLSRKIGEGWFANNIGDAIISVKLIKTPGSIETQSYDSIIVPANAISDIEVEGRYVVNQFQRFDLGSYSISEIYGSFIDYQNTTVALYLPFCGVQQLSAKTVIGSTLSITAYIDYVTGGGTYYVTIKRDGVTQVLYEYPFISSMEVPLTGIEFAQKLTQLFSSTVGLTTSMMTSSPLGVVSSATGIAKTIMSNEHYSIGSVQSNNGWSGIMYPFLIFQRNKASYPTTFNETVGKPSMRTLKLGDCHGYTKVYDMHLDGINALEAEKMDLLDRLKQGVIL